MLCPICLARPAAFAPGPLNRPGARCPRCQGLERHRLLAVVLAGLDPVAGTGRLVLEVAPSPAVTRLLRRRPGRYLGVDIAPAADGRSVDVVADLRRLPLDDDAVGLAVVFHVFEHIPDDTGAMAELARVLAPGAVALVQVPWRPGRPTDEDPGAGELERVRRFGQADHVRFYGDDFEERLRRSGLTTARVGAADLLPDDLVDGMGLTDRTPVWVGWTARAPGPGGDPADVAGALRRRLESGAIAEWRRLRTLPPDAAPLPGWVRRLARTRVGRAVRRLAP